VSTLIKKLHRNLHTRHKIGLKIEFVCEFLCSPAGGQFGGFKRCHCQLSVE